jgi:hypothetical protein
LLLLGHHLDLLFDLSTFDLKSFNLHSFRNSSYPFISKTCLEEQDLD